jgi:hypothetical protein
MTEELKQVGGEMRPEGVANEPGAALRPEAGPSGILERAPEQVAETANEKYSEILSKASPQDPSATTPAPSQVEIDAKAVYDETDAEARVTKLVALAETRGIEHSVRVAQKLNDFYVLDRMHDELSEKFYDALKEKGLIKE